MSNFNGHKRVMSTGVGIAVSVLLRRWAPESVGVNNLLL